MKLGSWTPDLPEYGHDGLVRARNSYSGILGYEPIKALSAVTAALPATWRGGGSFEGPDGSKTLLAGTDGGLYSLSSSAATSQVAGSYSAPWYFLQFGDDVVCLNGGAPLKFTLSTGVGATLGGTPPSLSYGAIVKGFVFGAGNSSNTNRVYWSGLEEAESWTIGTNQCDVQDIPDGGAITGLAGGEYGLAFQDEAITMFEYVGSPVIFQTRKVSNSIGALCHGSIAQHGRQTFFYSRRGFHKFIDGEVSPIGRNKVDRTFRSTYSTAEIIDNLRCAIDPERSLVIWSMPDRLWVYNFENDMWSDIAIGGIVGISTGATASLTLDGIAAIYPSIEDVTPSLDDPFWRGGAPLLLIVKSDNILYAFGAADNLEARFRFPQIEMFSGRTAHVRNSRVIGDMLSATVSLDCRTRRGDSATNVTSTDFRENGEVPIRASGRYIQPEIILASDVEWSGVQEFELEASPGGRR